MVIHAGIGGGKTSTARAIDNTLRDRGFSVRGILSVRLFGGVSEGYNAEDLEVGEVYPLVRLTTSAEGVDWETYGNPMYSFSYSGFERANNALRVAAKKMASGTVVFLDEYGKLESGVKAYARGSTPLFPYSDGEVLLWSFAGLT